MFSLASEFKMKVKFFWDLLQLLGFLGEKKQFLKCKFVFFKIPVLREIWTLQVLQKKMVQYFINLMDVKRCSEIGAKINM